MIPSTSDSVPQLDRSGPTSPSTTAGAPVLHLGRVSPPGWPGGPLPAASVLRDGAPSTRPAERRLVELLEVDLGSAAACQVLLDGLDEAAASADARLAWHGNAWTVTVDGDRVHLDGDGVPPDESSDPEAGVLGIACLRTAVEAWREFLQRADGPDAMVRLALAP